MNKHKNKFFFIPLLLCGFLLQAKVAISKVEYYSGDDFIQLYFQTNKIIPIPEVIYPRQDEPRNLVMRVGDADIQVERRQWIFDSPVVSEVDLKPAEGYADIEIHLKESVNYRVFTNQNGLYIEFPVVKEVMAEKKPPTVITPQVNDRPPEATRPASPAVPAGLIQLKDLRLASKSEGRVAFDVLLSAQAEYRVIPITEPPVRLAIDLKNVQARKINREFAVNNVQAARGANHSSDTFRLVFDLSYLKNYTVKENGNALRVEFFDEAEAVSLAQQKAPTVDEPSEPVGAAAPQETNPAIETPPEPKPVEAIESPATIVAESKTETPPPAAKTEFFSEEKAKTESAAAANFITFQDEEGTEQTTYLKQTVEEGSKRYTGTPMTFTFKDADLSNVLKFIAKEAGLNLVIDPGVTGKITCELEKVPWDQALEIFLKINSLDMVLEGNILRIGKVSTLASEAQRRRELREAKEMETNLEVSTRTLSYAKVGDVLKILNDQLSPRGKIVPDPRTNTLIISEVPDRLVILDKLIDTIDSATPQVSIEARIVEAVTNYTQNLGIQWGYNLIADAAHGNQTSLRFPNSIGVSGNNIANRTAPGIIGPLGGYAINLPSPTFNSGTVFSFGNIANTFNLDLALTAMQRNGKGQIISSPKVTTQNNKKADIIQGSQIPVQTVQNNTVTVRYVAAALELHATPQITAKGTIIMDLDIQNNAPDFANLVNGIPPINTQSITNTVMVNDGATIVIGGMYRTTNDVTKESVPLLGRIPLIGALFRNSQKTGQQKELLIFITPRIIK